MERPGRRAGLGILLFIVVAAGPVLARGEIVHRAQPADFEIQRKDLFDKRRVVTLTAITASGTKEVKTKAELAALPPNTLMAARLKSEPVLLDEKVPGGGTTYRLPYQFEFTGTGSTRVRYHTVAIVEGIGLAADPATGNYRGAVFVGVRDKDGAVVDLPSPIPFLVTYSGGTATPTNLSINHTNLPYARVLLNASSIPARSFVTVRTTFDANGLDVPVPVATLGGEMGAPESIPGFGFGFGKVVVQVPRNLVGTVSEVSLSTSRGSLDPTRIPLSETGSGEATLRSSGLGDATIRVLNTELGIPSATVRFAWPWVLAIFMVAGAAIGGVLYLKGGGKGGFVVGCLLGLVVSAAACAGINLAGYPMPSFVTEGAAGVLGALPGYLKFRGGKKKED